MYYSSSFFLVILFTITQSFISHKKICEEFNKYCINQKLTFTYCDRFCTKEGACQTMRVPLLLSFPHSFFPVLLRFDFCSVVRTCSVDFLRCCFLISAQLSVSVAKGNDFCVGKNPYRFRRDDLVSFRCFFFPLR